MKNREAHVQKKGGRVQNSFPSLVGKKKKEDRPRNFERGKRRRNAKEQIFLSQIKRKATRRQGGGGIDRFHYFL